MLLRSNLIFLAAGLLLAIGVLMTDEVNGDQSGSTAWKVTVSPEQDAGHRWQLKVVMEYHGKQGMTIPNTAVPWRWPYSMIVCAVPSTGGVPQALPSIVPLIDPPAGMLTIEPGETIQGEVPLSTFFSDFEKQLDRSPVIVFWYLRPNWRSQINPIGGWVEVPKNLVQ